MRRKGFTARERNMIAILMIIVLTSAILSNVLRHPHRGGSGRIHCMSNLKQIGIALMQYNQDYNERYPLIVATSHSNALSEKPIKPGEFCNYGWADAIYPYLKNQRVYQCPIQEQNYQSANPFAPTERGFTDYWFNSNLDGVALKSLVQGDATTIISIGDGNDGGDMTDARYNLSALPASWLNDQGSPCYRHIGSAMYGFLDGHAKVLMPNKITNRQPGDKQPTFAVR